MMLPLMPQWSKQGLGKNSDIYKSIEVPTQYRIVMMVDRTIQTETLSVGCW